MTRPVGLLFVVSALLAAGAACGEARPRPDERCLERLRASGVRFSEGPELRGVRTPVTLDGASFPVRLRPRGTRPAEMDCRLAAGLAAAAPTFARHGITALEFSAAYHYRNRRGTERLSAHAQGLAIDVHVLHGGRGAYVIERDFERGVGRWRDLRAEPGAYHACVGKPRTAKGKTLRQLACRLKLHEDFRVIITPDDDRDHRDHLHLEVYGGVD